MVGREWSSGALDGLAPVPAAKGLLAAGVAAAREGDCETAERLLSQARELAADRPELVGEVAQGFVELARRWASQGEQRRAFATAQGAVELHEGCATGHLVLGELHAANGEPGPAERHLERALEAAPGDVAIIEALGKLHEERRSGSRLIELSKLALGASPTPQCATIWSRRLRAAGLPGDDALAVRVAILSSFNADWLVPHIELGLLQESFEPQLHVAPFGQYAQAILDSDGELYGFRPDIVFLAATANAIDARATDVPFVTDRGALIDEIIDSVRMLAAALREHTTAQLVIHNFVRPYYSPLGIADVGPRGQARFYQELNERLAAAVEPIEGVTVLDADNIQAACGKRPESRSLHYMAAMEIDERALPGFARAYVACIRALRGRSRKCVVVDLDNTLWGGILGEDGLDGIGLDPTTYPGNAFREFQSRLLNLYRRGVLLAVCSKNNEAEAVEAIEKHPHMLLRLSHFAAHRINWNDKATGIAEIAQELNIGLDSIVFLDDSRMECAWVRQQLPAVWTVVLPSSPADYVGVIEGLDVLDTFAVTEEDRKRGEMYATERLRRESEVAAPSLGEFLRGLDITVTVARDPETAVDRLAQLTQRTNQFNLTTRRYARGDMQRFIASGNARVYAATVSDRFGELGTVGLCIVEFAGDTWVLDTFLLSCRALGRGVEDSLMAAVVADAKAAHVAAVTGQHIPTPKNALCADFLSRMGFAEDGNTAEAARWRLDVRSSALEAPEWVHVVDCQGDPPDG